ncbi:MAG: hypothetical protein ACREFQ_13185 [Stellaceae bacterium]
MPRRKSTTLILAELGLAAFETVALRMSLMARGAMSDAEYRRMTTEKLIAAQRSMLAALRPGQGRGRAMIAPFHRAARANAKRLRRKKHR